MNQKTGYPLQRLQKNITLPILTIDTVYHIGTMGVDTKRRGGYEADCLSVSLCPEAWQEIARLGGYPWWELKKRGRGRFIDIINIAEDDESTLKEWGVLNGFLLEETAYKVYHSNEEGERCFIWYSSYEEAESECEEDEDGELEKPEETKTLVSTEYLQKLREKDRKEFDDSALDLVAITLAIELKLDGVWWQENYDPSSLSAPRAGIVQEQVSSWQATETLQDIYDDELLENFPEAKLQTFLI